MRHHHFTLSYCLELTELEYYLVAVELIGLKLDGGEVGVVYSVAVTLTLDSHTGVVLIVLI